MLELWFLYCADKPLCDRIPASDPPFATYESCNRRGSYEAPRMKVRVHGYVCLPTAAKADREAFTPKVVSPEIFKRPQEETDISADVSVIPE